MRQARESTFRMGNSCVSGCIVVVMVNSLIDSMLLLIMPITAINRWFEAVLLLLLLLLMYVVVAVMLLVLALLLLLVLLIKIIVAVLLIVALIIIVMLFQAGVAVAVGVAVVADD